MRAVCWLQPHLCLETTELDSDPGSVQHSCHKCILFVSYLKPQIQDSMQFFFFEVIISLLSCVRFNVFLWHRYETEHAPSKAACSLVCLSAVLFILGTYQTQVCSWLFASSCVSDNDRPVFQSSLWEHAKQTSFWILFYSMDRMLGWTAGQHMHICAYDVSVQRAGLWKLGLFVFMFLSLN